MVTIEVKAGATVRAEDLASLRHRVWLDRAALWLFGPAPPGWMRAVAADRLAAARREAWSALFKWNEERRSAACVR